MRTVPQAVRGCRPSTRLPRLEGLGRPWSRSANAGKAKGEAPAVTEPQLEEELKDEHAGRVLRAKAYACTTSKLSSTDGTARVPRQVLARLPPSIEHARRTDSASCCWVRAQGKYKKAAGILLCPAVRGI